MSDYERYGDYNEADEAPAGSGKVVLIARIIQILIAAVLILVIGLVIARVILFNFYPSSVTDVLYTDALAAYRDANGTADLMTQRNDILYDDADEGNFFFDKLVCSPNADHLQVAFKYNVSLIAAINEEYGTALDPNADPTELFDFTLVKTRDGFEGTGKVEVESVGTMTGVITDSLMMYRYIKVAFDGVDFGFDEGESPVGWFRLDITPRGIEVEEPYSLAVYIKDTELVAYGG